MRRITTLAGALAFALFAAASASAAVVDHRIAVVNDSDAPIAIYAEDAEGTLHEVVTLKAGEVRLVDTEIEGADRKLRLHARPTNSTNRLSTWGHEGIVTEPLEITEDESAIFWIASDLAKSLVEIRDR